MAEDQNNVHLVHPSLAALQGKVDEAKQGLDTAAQEKEYTQKHDPSNLKSGNLRPFKNKGEKMFKVLYDGIGVYDDKELQEETFSIMLEKDAILPGTYVNDKVVLFGDPYNVYCSAINVEPTDITHQEYKDNQHQYDTTVVINQTDLDQDDFVVVDENQDNNNDHMQSSPAPDSEFEAISPSAANQQEAPPAVPPAVVPPPAPQQPAEEQAEEDDEYYEEEEYEEVAAAPPQQAAVATVPPPAPAKNASASASDNDNTSRLGSNLQYQGGGLPPPVSPSQSAVSRSQPQQQVPPTPPQQSLQQPQEPPMQQEEIVANQQVYGSAYEVDDEERKTMDHGKAPGANGGHLRNVSVVPTTGNVLEDLDNLLRIYRNLKKDKERELVYREFWEKYDRLCGEQPHLVLQIPSRVRGFLLVMQTTSDGGADGEGMEPFRRDRIMMHVLSRNGLLEEPAYIRNRFLYTYFVQHEIFNYMKWFCQHCGSVQSWMFFFLWLLMLAQIIHIGLDFGRGNPWRAVLMECLIPLTFIASIQYVNTPFTANILRTLIENKCAALSTVYGRVSLNVLLIFFCLGSVHIEDALILSAAFFCAIWTAIVFMYYSRLKHSSNYVRIATGTVKKLKEKFLFSNESKDGVLNAVELRNFFKSYNQIVPMWQVELMIAQYDIHRDGGLRFDALRIWFEKIPINHTTRMNLLSAKPTSLYDENGNSPMDTAGGGLNEYDDGFTPGAANNNQLQVANSAAPQYTAAEKEWLGLAGKKYMNQ